MMDVDELRALYVFEGLTDAQSHRILQYGAEISRASRATRMSTS